MSVPEGGQTHGLFIHLMLNVCQHCNQSGWASVTIYIPDAQCLQKEQLQ